MSAEERSRYGEEVRRLFDQREKDLDPAVDAGLRFTTSVGYRPPVLDLPAWIAVFFHPKTDEAIIEQINLYQRLTEDSGPPVMVDENALSSVALARRKDA